MSSLRETLQANLHAVHARITQAAGGAGRDPTRVRLLAVSKSFNAEAVVAAAACGQAEFGENYVQEAIDKMARVRELNVQPLPPLQWHFIGPIQSNKTRDIAAHFDWVQSVDRARIAERLSSQRDPAQTPLNVLLQVNISGEASKSGATPAELPGLARTVAGLPHLCLRGLMAIPEPETDPARQRAAFERTRAQFDRLLAEGHPLDTLSMGMSADLDAAITAGATMVRIGTAIFGARLKEPA